MTTHPLHEFVLDWKAFSDDDIFHSVDSIRRFSVSVQFPRFIAWRNTDAMNRYQDVLYESVYDMLEHAGFFRFEELKRNQSARSVGVTYADPDYGFSVRLDDDAEITLERDGSSLQLFYDWYNRVLPRLTNLVTALREQLQGDAGAASSPKRIEPARARYAFSFILHDLTRGPRRQKVKNSEVLRTALTHVPGERGALVELTPNVLEELGRVDLSVSRWHTSPSGRVREVYSVEAPGNRDYGTLWLQLTYIAETPSDAGTTREQPDFDLFLSRYDYPLQEFVRERALCNFLAAITENVNFKTAPGQLP